MMCRTRAIPWIYLVGVILLTGCSQRPPEKVPLAGAYQKFIKICQEEHKLNVVVKALEHTVWIYVPLQEELMQIAATPEGAQKSGTPEERPAVKYLQSSYENRRFVVTYDIHADKTYAQSQGTKLDYAPPYHQVSQQITTAVSQSYFEAADAPLFFVVVIADVLNGVEIENIFYLEDLKRYMMFENIPQEEFVKRSLYEIKGKTDWIGDTQGRHLAYTEITLPEFLARQITNRINFKYQKSSFPPSADTRREILDIIAQTFKNYNFTDFNYIKLHDLNTGLIETVLPSEFVHKDEQPDTSGQ